MKQRIKYYPFGETRSQEGTAEEDKLFTGHKQDDTGLYYANARYLNPVTGQFTSIDPASRSNPEQFLYDPQQLNGYSYVRNNPVVLVDPDGEKSSAFQQMMQSLNRLDIQVGTDLTREVQTTAKAAEQLVKTTGAIGVAAGLGTAAYTAGAAATVAALTNPATLGAATNVAERAYWDYQDDGSLDESASNYAGSAVFGAVGGKYFSKSNIVRTSLGAGFFEGLEGVVVEGDLDPSSIAGNTLGAGFAKGILGKSTGQAFKSVFDIGFTKLSEAAAEFVGTIGSTQVIRDILGDN